MGAVTRIWIVPVALAISGATAQAFPPILLGHDLSAFLPAPLMMPPLTNTNQTQVDLTNDDTWRTLLTKISGATVDVATLPEFTALAQPFAQALGPALGTTPDPKLWEALRRLAIDPLPPLPNQTTPAPETPEAKLAREQGVYYALGELWLAAQGPRAEKLALFCLPGIKAPDQPSPREIRTWAETVGKLLFLRLNPTGTNADKDTAMQIAAERVGRISGPNPPPNPSALESLLPNDRFPNARSKFLQALTTGDKVMAVLTPLSFPDDPPSGPNETPRTGDRAKYMIETADDRWQEVYLAKRILDNVPEALAPSTVLPAQSKRWAEKVVREYRTRDGGKNTTLTQWINDPEPAPPPLPPLAPPPAMPPLPPVANLPPSGPPVGGDGLTPPFNPQPQPFFDPGFNPQPQPFSGGNFAGGGGSGGSVAGGGGRGGGVRRLVPRRRVFSGRQRQRQRRARGGGGLLGLRRR